MQHIGPKTTEWFTYFPEDYRWSAAIGGMLGLAVVGASDMGEIDRTARKLKNKLGDDEAWFFTWQELGDELKQKADDCRNMDILFLLPFFI